GAGVRSAGRVAPVAAGICGYARRLVRTRGSSGFCGSGFISAAALSAGEAVGIAERHFGRRLGAGDGRAAWLERFSEERFAAAGQRGEKKSKDARCRRSRTRAGIGAASGGAEQFRPPYELVEAVQSREPHGPHGSHEPHQLKRGKSEPWETCLKSRHISAVNYRK